MLVRLVRAWSGRVVCVVCLRSLSAWWVRPSFHLIPHLIKRGPAGGWVRVGVAGWNTCRCWSERPGCGRLWMIVGRLGTLLGPEETPVGVFLVPLLVVVV